MGNAFRRKLKYKIVGILNRWYPSRKTVCIKSLSGHAGSSSTLGLQFEETRGRKLLGRRPICVDVIADLLDDRAFVRSDGASCQRARPAHDPKNR